MSEIPESQWDELCKENQRLKKSLDWRQEQMKALEQEHEEIRAKVYSRTIEAIERLNNIIRATEMERDAGDKVAENLRDQIKRLKALLTRAADALEDLKGPGCKRELIDELREAAE